MKLTDAGRDLDNHIPYSDQLPTLLGGYAQVLANMLANAVKFTDAGEILVAADVERLADGGASGRQRFHLTILDTGIGIDPDSMKKLFQCFRQGHESMSRKYGGTGAGWQDFPEP